MKKTLAAIILSALGFLAQSQSLYFDDVRIERNLGDNCRHPCAFSAFETGSDSLFVWQETDPRTKGIYLSACTSRNGIDFASRRRFAGPFFYSTDNPQVYSAASRNGTSLATVMREDGKISVYSSADFFGSTEKTDIAGEGFFAPRIFPTSGGQWVMFASRAENENYHLCVSMSPDGKTWQNFEDFSAADRAEGAFNPVVPKVIAGNGGDYIFFQSQFTSEGHISIQIYGTFTKDWKTFSKPVLVTGKDSVDEGTRFSDFSNQNADAITDGGKIVMVWERSSFNSTNSSVMMAEIGQDFSMKQAPEKISSSGFCSTPVIFKKGDSSYIYWFTTVEENRKIYLAERKGFEADEPEVISKGESVQPCHSLSGNGNLTFLWSSLGKKQPEIAVLRTDTSATPPKIAAVNFSAGKRSSSRNVKIKLSPAYDSSGIKAMSAVWTQDENELPPKSAQMSPDAAELAKTAESDGKWFFRARQQDFAGNWSEPATVEYFLDTTPPLPPTLSGISRDKGGFWNSNTFSLSWGKAETDSDIAGWTYSMSYIAPVSKRFFSTKRRPLRATEDSQKEYTESLLEKNMASMEGKKSVPRRIVTKKNGASFSNLRNGLYAFTVAAVDEVGNIGETRTETIILNKYEPATYITAVNCQQNSFGDAKIEIFGGGFTYDGTITEIFLDKDGSAPYDVTLRLQDKDFTVRSDDRITDINLKYTPEGKYKVGLLHSDRGIFFSKTETVTIKETGTVKKRWVYDFIPSFNFAKGGNGRSISILTPVFIISLILALAVIFMSSRSLVKSAKESFMVNAEVRALLEGGAMPQEKSRTSAKRSRGFSLKSKLVLHSTILIAVMDLLIFMVFGYYMTATQEKTLARSLANRAKVMLTSISSGTRIYLPQSTREDNLSLSDIVSQAGALNEGIWCTVTGFDADGNTTAMDHIWALTDMSILKDGELVPGETKLEIEGLSEIYEKCSRINETAEAQAGLVNANISELTKEGLSLSLKTDEDSISRRREIQTIRNQLTSRLDGILESISEQNEGSIPEFNTESIDKSNTEYIFYKPVLYRQNNDPNYVHGIVFMKISTQSLVDQIERERMTIATTCGIILAVALILAFMSTNVMALLIVRPINKLARHVELIRDTDDKEKLAGKDIILKSKDEIGLLGETVNEMTHGLVEAAVQAKNLTLGKDIQTRFIPLDMKDGMTLTTGKLSAKGADFFSYYAGADDLSGDYFDYKQIDDRHFAIIKCDVSGHGVPAALIMVEVATLFLNSFKHWSMRNPSQGINMAPVVGQINDLLESRGFKGRFAAFTLCILNTESGECWFCNAGDNMIHIFDSASNSKRVIKMQETPAAGMFPTDLVEMKGGYQVSKLLLKKNDVLFLFTDGIEEAKRNFRDENRQIIKCSESGLSEGDEHENHMVGDDNEEMTPERVTDIIEAVYGRKKYVLHKFHTLEGEENDFEFDFTTCGGSAEEAVMALVSVEKVFRMYKAAEPKQSDRVKVDRNIDSFLREHFMQYAEWCHDHQDIESDPTHLYYRGVLEDPQYDDLTLIAVKKQ